MLASHRHVLLYGLIVLAAAWPGAPAAQVRFGLRAGVSLAATAEDVAEFDYRSRAFRLSVADVASGFHLGFFVQGRLGDKWVLQPGLLVHSTRTDYLLEELLQAETIASVRSERFSAVELPMMVAYRWGALRLQAGPVGRARFAQSSELQGVAGYTADLDADDLTIGYQAGIGLDVWRILLDVKYDGTFASTDAVINIGGDAIAFSERSSRTYLTLGYALFGRK